MKRIIFLICMMTIALASVCWADDLTGVWKFESIDVVETEPNTETAETLKKLTETPIDYDVFITARPDGTMVEFQDLGVSYNCNIGKWYQCTPDTYMFIYDSLSTEKTAFLTLNDGVLKYRYTFRDVAYLELTYTKVEEGIQ